jgi:hypothetical protein
LDAQGWWLTILLVQDFKQCDLLIVMGTSLEVQPFASLINRVPVKTPRLLLNREVVGLRDRNNFIARLMGGAADGFRFDSDDNYRDIKHLGDIQESIQEFVTLLGWQQDLDKLRNVFVADAAATDNTATVATAATTPLDAATDNTATVATATTTPPDAAATDNTATVATATTTPPDAAATDNTATVATAATTPLDAAATVADTPVQRATTAALEASASSSTDSSDTAVVPSTPTSTPASSSDDAIVPSDKSN